MVLPVARSGWLPVRRTLVGHLERYAAFAVPVETGTTVLPLCPDVSGYKVVTDRGTWQTRHVVIATGPWGQPNVPEMMHRLDDNIGLTTANQYRNVTARRAQRTRRAQL
ncbi:MAG: NAD(P)-binding domain-containing protein [Dermatophilaceae bacterium]